MMKGVMEPDYRLVDSGFFPIFDLVGKAFCTDLNKFCGLSDAKDEKSQPN